MFKHKVGKYRFALMLSGKTSACYYTCILQCTCSVLHITACQQLYRKWLCSQGSFQRHVRINWRIWNQDEMLLIFYHHTHILYHKRNDEVSSFNFQLAVVYSLLYVREDTVWLHTRKQTNVLALFIISSCDWELFVTDDSTAGRNENLQSWNGEGRPPQCGVNIRCWRLQRQKHTFPLNKRPESSSRCSATNHLFIQPSLPLQCCEKVLHLLVLDCRLYILDVCIWFLCSAEMWGGRRRFYCLGQWYSNNQGQVS